MLNSYEEGLTCDVIDVLFNELKEKLVPLISKLNNKKVNVKMNVSKDVLIKCAEYILSYMGFDMNKAALGIYPHGFTEKIGNNDIRIAFKFTDNPFDFVTTIVHEGGHGILEQNVDNNLTKYECATWYPIYDEVKNMLGLDINLEEFAKGLNCAMPSLVRTEADELTYCMHIILRYEIERDLFNGNLSVDDLPKVWNRKMKEYLGVQVTNDSEGVLQDVHWAEGAFGYFPSYLIGSIFDGMLLEVVNRDLGNIDEILKNGNIKVITDFLCKKIYVNGGAYTGVEVLKKMGYDKISVEPLVKYFYEKYDK